ncbi:hypothetical protein [uncultured Desulfobacter sp.]|uniref:hypothetical protein n=1 Tax=uncultured Desulfobacter sp. TaxID=240139 RepID=UPI0029C61483|nr:hypothetical protein [uncultured Desulfobacter sp.]
MLKMKNLFFIFILIFFPITGIGTEIEKFHARPDQVLVLYNEDWEKDVDGSLPGQDSKEVAEYYQKRHTDSILGLKPYILGLKCTHKQKHLTHWYIKEKSQDNKNGVVFKGKGVPPGNKEWARDSRHVEIVVDNKKGDVDWDSIQIWCSPLSSKKKIKVTPVASGVPLRHGKRWTYPQVEPGKGQCFRFDAHELFSGTIWVYFEAKDKNGGKICDLKLKYYDRDDFEFSLRGKDGIIDEKHFQEDVAIPVKRFLEDPKNTSSDGTLLKNHILYIVVCHGLPFSCEGVFGIERGTTHHSIDHGDLGSLEQRLQTLYYGWMRVKPPVISMYMDGGPDSKNGVRHYRITTAMRYPMYGKRWNVYMHPDTYSYLRKEKKEIGDYKIPPFPEVRKKTPEHFFGYGVSRIDGQGPVEAKRLVDYAIYASKYLRPEMLHAHEPPTKNSLKKSDKKSNLKDVYQGKNWALPNIPELGFEKKPGQMDKGIPFLKFNQDISMNRFRYLPGGMDRVVNSANGWNFNRDQPIWKQVDEGVTVSACGGPAYGGGPHITNATFWDNRILMRYLFRGRDLGESLLLSTIYINWSTSLVGDPLYHPDLNETVIDKSPPTISGKDAIKIALFPTMEKYTAVIKVPVRFSLENPEVALLKAYFKKDEGDIEQSVSSSIFSAQPKIVLRNLETNNTYKVRLTLTDPYGNESDLSERFGCIRIPVRGDNKDKHVWQQAVKRNNNWIFGSLLKKRLSEQGTIQVCFEGGKDGLLPSIEAGGMNFKVKKISNKGNMKVSLKLAGVTHGRLITSILAQGEKSTLIVRWRRYPLTREVSLKANNGIEFPLIADTRTPWEKMSFSGDFKIIEGGGGDVLSASIIDDADVASPDAMGLELPFLNKEEWLEAQN